VSPRCSPLDQGASLVHDSLGIGLSQFVVTVLAASENVACFKSNEKGLSNNHFTFLFKIGDTHGRIDLYLEVHWCGERSLYETHPKRLKCM
jgi:hypothetical protein